ncbi:MAG: nitrate/nitrite two-component system sensor histidine kinase NarQ [Shewanella sp.]|nr:nitrate/nitrite two-component system sensor histidine kinase NarQ [Shewanella sp.]MCF1430042.1 nitrate/nitrite two-component system sensor histidine kinase NarQ [Shewanella sp.]MCF1439732.1 nitrate/nitrite two-component system sensor histidine kinase NarQ [Shewanella sp.]MCF1458865.1 nitrate/nitrite two-component system sensor histidine kinase NarQ [Shewanella sp.]
MKQASLTSTILGVMLVLILLSSGLATFALGNLFYSLEDSRAINASGSLRMQSYRLIFFADSGSKEAENKIRQFENTLYSDDLKHAVSWAAPAALGAQYSLVVDKWQTMKQFIQQENSRSYATSLKDFVDTIDLLVLEMEHHAEFKLKVLAISQLLGLGLMLLIAFFAVRYTRKRVVIPLQQMMVSAESISKGQFELEMPKTNYVELTALNDALQSTARELSSLYRNLESQVEDKTRALTQAHLELTLLYDSLMLLHTRPLDRQLLGHLLEKLRKNQQLTHIRLLLGNEDDTDEITDPQGWPASSLPSARFVLKCDESELGYLDVITDETPNQLLLLNYAMMLARSIVIHNSGEQRQQLALMEERGIIARELHDSLGQLLSFLKIQISLLRKSLEKANANARVKQQMNEINEGINTAYAQLRELLSTFRLTTKEPNLRRAIEAMLDQLRAKTEVIITLDYKLPGTLLSANQHIHILQLIREATLNAIKHANASQINIQCQLENDGMLHIRICDNGIGLDHIKERDQHFGISIMHERASKLAGVVEFAGNAEGGTTVDLCFPPQETSQYE